MAKPAPITIPTEPMQYPRPADLIERVARGDSEDPNLAPFYEDAIQDTMWRFEATGLRHNRPANRGNINNFATYCVHVLPNTAPDGFKIPFSDGHTRRLSRLTTWPFPLQAVRRLLPGCGHALRHVPVKQAGDITLPP